MKCIKTMDIFHTFQNVKICLHIFLTMPETNCLSESSFLFLEQIKIRLRSFVNLENWMH